MTALQACANGLLYAVRPGQSLFRIAQQFAVTLTRLRQANPGVDPTNLQVGQVLCIPGVRESVCPRGRLRVVQPGETLFTIAQDERIPVADLVEANYWLPDPSVIYPGEQLCVPLVVPTTGCCIVLQPTEEAESFTAGGTVLIDEVAGDPRVTFLAVGLPAPSTFGDYDSYIGDLVFREIERLIPLKQCAAEGQETLWTGSRVVDVPAISANVVAMFPYSTQTEERGPDLLTGRVVDCT